MSKIIDAEKMQEINRLLVESFKAYAESERQMKISDDLAEKAIMIALSEDAAIEEIIISIKRRMEK